MNQLNTTYQGILKVTAPLVIAGIAMNLVGVVDLILVTGLGEAQVGGTGNGQLLYALLFVVGMGFTSGMQIIIGRRNGSQEHQKIGSLFFQGAYFVAAFAAFLFLFIQLFIPAILDSLFESVNVVKYASVYMKTRGWGIIFTMSNLLFIGFFVGITKTKILGYFTPFISALNIGLDLALINGYGPFPQLGVQGAALASVISEASGTLLFVIYTVKFVDLRKYNLERFLKFNWDQTKIIFEVASPIMVQNIVSIGAWFTFFVFVESLGERALAISQMIRGIYIFIMVPVFSLADAANTFVSNLMGEKSFERVIPVVKKTLFLGFLVNLFFFTTINLFPEFVMGLFTNDHSVFDDALTTLRLTTFSMFLFTLGFIPFRAISGTGNTKTALAIESASVFIYLIYTYYASVVIAAPLHLVWASEFVYFGFMIAFSWSYLKWGKWRLREI